MSYLGVYGSDGGGGIYRSWRAELSRLEGVLIVLVGVAELLVGLLGTTGCWADKIIGLKIKVHFNYELKRLVKSSEGSTKCNNGALFQDVTQTLISADSHKGEA